MPPEKMIHPRTGELLEPVGIVAGRPVWPILGAAEGDPAPESEPEGDVETDVELEPDDLEKTKTALAKARADLREASKGSRRAVALQAEVDRLKAAAAPTADDAAKLDQQLQQARDEAAAEARLEVAKDRALDRVEIVAASVFRVPADAVMHLRGQLDDLLDGDKPDVEAIKDAVAELAKNRPDLTIAGTKPAPRTAADGGTPPGGGKTTPATLADAVAEHYSTAAK